MLQFVQFFNLTSEKRKEKLIKDFDVSELVLEKVNKKKCFLIFVFNKEIKNGKNINTPYCFFCYFINKKFEFKYFFNHDVNNNIVYIDNINYVDYLKLSKDIEKIIEYTRKVSGKENVLLSISKSYDDNKVLEYKFINYKIPINKLMNPNISKSDIDFEYVDKHIVHVNMKDNLTFFINNDDKNITLFKLCNYTYKMDPEPLFNNEYLNIYSTKPIEGIPCTYITDKTVYQESNDYIKHKRGYKKYDILINRIDFSIYTQAKIKSIYKKLNTNIPKKDLIDNNKYLVYLFERNGEIIGNLIIDLINKEVKPISCQNKDKNKLMENYKDIVSDVMETKEITGLYRLW